jgi:RNA polymerase sigma-70 factor (ECF subfamily)
MHDDDADRRLLERFRGGDREAFAELVARYQRPVYNAAWWITRSADDANDVAQDVFLKVAEHLDDYDPRFRPFSWIYRIAVNEALNLVRRHGRSDPLDDEADADDDGDGDPARIASDGEIARRLQDALMRLPAHDRAVITLRHFAELSYREIADALDLDEKTVKSRLFEARSRLKLRLADLGVR